MRDHLPLRTLPTLGLLIAGLYLLLHPYRGLVHDSRLYTLQALSHLHPELYANDIFLKYGSQDSYTLFTPLYAAIVSVLGAEPAASLVTFVSVLALLLAAWFLARTLMPAAFSWLAVGVLVLTPGFYGSGETFSVLEGFVTPRLPAEALVLFSLTAWLRERRLLAAALLLAGMLLHPIMSFPAILLLAFMSSHPPQWRRLWPLALVGALITALALVGWLPIARWQFDAAWWPMADRVPHLVLGHWTVHDWARIATLFATLNFAWLYLPGAAQRLALGILITCVITLFLSWVGGDLLKLVLVVQGQAWRSLWLATATSALMLPWVVACAWRGPPLRRCAVLLLLSAWFVGPVSLAMYFSIPAVITAACSGMRLPDRYARYSMLGAVILLAVIILCLLAATWSEYGGIDTQSNVPSWPQTLHALCKDGLLPCAVLLGVWYLAANYSSSRTATVSLTLIVAAPVMLVATAAARSWSVETYPQASREAFATWRAMIPPGSDVLWATKFVPDSDPMGAWLLLERPSYYSSVQVNSGLFSRPAAIELRRRAETIPLALPTEMPLDIVFGGEAGAPPTCDEIPVRYIVTNVTIPDAQLVPAPEALGPPFSELELRICPEPHAPSAGQVRSSSTLPHRLEGQYIAEPQQPYD